MNTYLFNRVEENPFKISFDFLKDTKVKEKKNDFIDDLLKKAYKNVIPWAKPKNDKNGGVYIELPKTENPYKINSVSPLALNLEWNKAASWLFNMSDYYMKPTYDFKIGDHAVKLHGNYIQIDDMIIPKFTNSDYFTTLPKKSQITIYKISMEINSLTFDLAA